MSSNPEHIFFGYLVDEIKAVPGDGWRQRDIAECVPHGVLLIWW